MDKKMSELKMVMGEGKMKTSWDRQTLQNV